jgi:ankyrin repeat protein
MNIHDEAHAGRLDAVRAYLAGGGEVDARDAVKRTLLHAAAEGAQPDVVAVLLAHGAQVDALDYKKNTPLHHAAGMGCATAVRSLLEAGAAATATNTYKETPLHRICHGGVSATEKDRLDIVDRLLATGAELEALDSADRTPLWFAAATGTAPLPAPVMKAKLDVVKRLLALGADPRRQARGQMGTPLDAARGLHQQEKYRFEWPEAVALLERPAPSPRTTTGRA